MSFIDANPSHSKEQLLNDIFAAANQGHMPGLPLRPFAALVVKVANETAETVAELKAHITRLNEQNARLQWWVVALAVAALIGTIVQTGAAIYALQASPIRSVEPTAIGPATGAAAKEVQALPSSSAAASVSAVSAAQASSPSKAAPALAAKQ